MMNRRQLLSAGAGLLATGAAAKAQSMGLPEAPIMETAATQITPEDAARVGSLSLLAEQIVEGFQSGHLFHVVPCE